MHAVKILGLASAAIIVAGLGAVAVFAAVAAATPAAPQVRPGQWQQQVRTTELDAPGLPPQALQMMPKSFSNSYCLTPEEAARGPREMLESAQRKDGGCTYTNFSMEGGKLTADMQCKGGAGGAGTMRMQMRGTYTATTYAMTMTMESNGPIRRMTSVSTGRLTGPCK